MSKTTLTLFLVLCIYSATILKSNRVLVNASPSLIKVPDDYPTIQEAINKAYSGDIVFVRNGTYKENIVINKSIKLVGENRENTIIDGGAKNNTISIKASSVTITGFTINNSYPKTGCGIYVERFGNVAIYNNKVVNNGIGVQTTFSSGNQIYDNIISANYIGIQLIYSSSNNIYKNTITGNAVGMDIYFYSIGNVIHENIISNNHRSIDISFYSSNNIFYYNNFINNSYKVYAETSNMWSYGDGGNYWDDYGGWDLNKDGIGDTPYNISERNIDRYPLMGRFNAFDIAFKGEKYNVAIISNSTILNFAFEASVKYKTRVIRFNASNINGFAGFSRIIIPKELMGNIHAVLTNNEENNATFLNTTDIKNFHLYVEYSGNCSTEIIYFELLDIYYQLLGELNGLNSTYNVVVEKFNTLNETLQNLLKDYVNLQKELQNMNVYYQNQAQNLKGLTYIFAAMAAIFIAVTIYLSKLAHEKQSPIIKG